MYEHRITGDYLRKVSSWEFNAFGCSAQFRTKSGATWVLRKQDVVKVKYKY